MKTEKNNYIILPSRQHDGYGYPDLLVSIHKLHFNMERYQCRDSLKQEDSLILTIRQFVDFLNLLRSGRAYNGNGKQMPQKQLNDVYLDAAGLKPRWRSEYFDAFFKEDGKGLSMVYHKINSNGALEEVTEPLEQCLMQDKLPGIDLEYWLNNTTNQGFPPKDNLTGTIHYWYPTEGCIAGFEVDPVRADFICAKIPDISFAVRRVCKK